MKRKEPTYIIMNELGMVSATPDSLQNPYSHAPFTMWEKSDTVEKGRQTVYSDRLYSWDSEKYDTLCVKHWNNKGHYFDKRTPASVEAFLSDYFGKKISLERIEQQVNLGSGYPLWRFDYRE